MFILNFFWFTDENAIYFLLFDSLKTQWWQDGVLIRTLSALMLTILRIAEVPSYFFVLSCEVNRDADIPSCVNKFFLWIQ